MKRLLAVLLLPELLMIFSMSVLSLNCYAAGQFPSQSSYFSIPSLLGFEQGTNRAFTNYNYSFSGGDAGIRLGNHRDTFDMGQNLPLAARNFRDIYLTGAYVRTMLGPLAFQGEALMTSGKGKFYNTAATGLGGQNQVTQTMALHLDARMDRGTAYMGSRVLYAVGGDDPTGKQAGIMSSEQAMAFGLENIGAFSSILLSGGYGDYLKTPGKVTGVKNNSDSIRLYQIYGGYAPSKKIDLMARLNYAETDKTHVGYNKSYGTELDIQGSYKISDNLTYNIGAAYLLTGDSFKSNTSIETSQTSKAYHLLHWLNLNF